MSEIVPTRMSPKRCWLVLLAVTIAVGAPMASRAAEAGPPLAAEAGSSLAAEAGSPLAAEAGSPLARLVAGDAGLCVEVNELAASFATFRATELYKRVSRFPPLAQFLRDNARDIAALGEELRRQTGLSPQELLDRLLGDRFLVAVWPGAADPQAPPGPALLILECHEKVLLTDVVARVLQAERAAGRRVDPIEWRRAGSQALIHRIEGNEIQPALFVAAVDSLAIVASEQALVADVLDRRAGYETSLSLADEAPYRAGMARLHPRATCRTYVNPRAWTGLLPQQAATPSAADMGPEALLAQQFHTADYITFAAVLGDKTVFEAFLHRADAKSHAEGELADQPLAGREGSKAGELSSAVPLADRLPAEAVAAIAGRVDLTLLLGTFFQQAPAGSDAQRGSAAGKQESAAVQALAALVTGKGNETVAALLPTRREADAAAADEARDGGGQVDADWVVGFDTNSLWLDEQSPLGERLSPILRGSLTAAIMLFNRQGESMSIDSVEEEGIPLTSVAGLALLGQGHSATFALAGGYYWAGTSRGAVRDVARLEASRALSAHPKFQALANPRLARRSHMAYLDLAALRGLLASAADKTNHSAVGRQDATDSPPGQHLRELLMLADQVLIEVEIDPAGVGLSATVTADAQP